MKTPENAGTKPEDWREKIRSEQLIEQIRIENNSAERESRQGDGWLTDHSSAIRELNAELDALLTCAPRAESDIDWERKAKIYNTTCEAQKVRILELVARADAAEAERDRLKEEYTQAHTERCELKRHEFTMERDIQRLREENEALRARLAPLAKQPLRCELDEEGRENGDYENAYDIIIEEIRALLRAKGGEA